MNNITGVARWDNSADKLKRWMDTDNYFEQFVKKIRIRPEWTILDIGCGPGDISIWAAKRAKHITALDHSAKMLDFLKDKIHRETLHNISCVQCSWDDEQAEELEMHDIVIASRSIATMENKTLVLRRINNCARHHVYITIGAKIKTPVTQSIEYLLGKGANTSSGFTFIYDHLYRIGIRANVEFIYGRSKFTDMNDVLDHFRWDGKELTHLQEKQLFKLFTENLIKRKDGTLSFPYNDLCWAVISWQKSGNK